MKIYNCHTIYYSYHPEKVNVTVLNDNFAENYMLIRLNFYAEIDLG